MIRYYKHKDKENVICDVIYNVARFGRWNWTNDVCSEIYTYKEVTSDFLKSFEEIEQRIFNNIWGNKLENA